jgi:hypothetical protein
MQMMSSINSNLKEDKMFNNRSVNLLAGLGVVILALLSIGAVVSTQRVASSASNNQLAPLDWYFAHDHAILDGDNTSVSNGMTLADNRLAPLDWYFAHDHAILDGNNTSVSNSMNLADNRLAPLDWYFTHDHAILDGDNNVVPR